MFVLILLLFATDCFSGEIHPNPNFSSCPGIKEGPTGPTGPTGPAGQRGPHGDKGKRGPTGPGGTGGGTTDNFLYSYGHYNGIETVGMSGDETYFHFSTTFTGGTGISFISPSGFSFNETGTYYIHAVVYAVPPAQSETNSIKAVFMGSTPTLPSTPLSYGPVSRPNDGYSLLVLQGVVDITVVNTTMAITSGTGAITPYSAESSDASNSVSIIKLS